MYGASRGSFAIASPPFGGLVERLHRPPVRATVIVDNLYVVRALGEPSVHEGLCFARGRDGRDGHPVLGAMSLRSGHEHTRGPEVRHLATGGRPVEPTEFGGGLGVREHVEHRRHAENGGVTERGAHVCVCESMSPGTSVFPLPSTMGVPLGGVIAAATRVTRPLVTSTLVFATTRSPSNRRTFWMRTEPSTPLPGAFWARRDALLVRNASTTANRSRCNDLASGCEGEAGLQRVVRIVPVRTAVNDDISSRLG